MGEARSQVERGAEKRAIHLENPGTSHYPDKEDEGKVKYVFPLQLSCRLECLTMVAGHYPIVPTRAFPANIRQQSPAMIGRHLGPYHVLAKSGESGPPPLENSRASYGAASPKPDQSSTW